MVCPLKTLMNDVKLRLQFFRDMLNQRILNVIRKKKETL